MQVCFWGVRCRGEQRVSLWDTADSALACEGILQIPEPSEEVDDECFERKWGEAATGATEVVACGRSSMGSAAGPDPRGDARSPNGSNVATVVCC